MIGSGGGEDGTEHLLASSSTRTTAMPRVRDGEGYGVRGGINFEGFAAAVDALGLNHAVLSESDIRLLWRLFTQQSGLRN